MQAFLDGKKIKYRPKFSEKWMKVTTPIWNFHKYEYSIESSEPELDKRLNFTIAYIDSKIPGKNSLYWKPIISIINQVDKSIQLEPECLDNFTVLDNFSNSIIQKVGELSSKIANFPINSNMQYYKQIIDENYFKSNLLSMFKKEPDVDYAYTEFNEYMKILKNNLDNSISVLKEHIQSARYNIVELEASLKIMNFLKYEVISRKIKTIDELSKTTLASKIVSLTNTLLIAKQLKESIHIRIVSLDDEVENIEHYDRLKISLDTLKFNDKKDFEIKFKNFIKN